MPILGFGALGVRLHIFKLLNAEEGSLSPRPSRALIKGRTHSAAVFSFAPFV